jgi:hypothetical protein
VKLFSLSLSLSNSCSFCEKFMFSEKVPVGLFSRHFFLEGMGGDRRR